MTALAQYRHSTRFRRFLHAFAFLNFALALTLPAMGTMVLEGSDYAKLERDPLAAAAFALYILCLPLLAKTSRFVGTALCLILMGFAVYRGHNYSALFLLMTTVILLPQRK